MKIGGRLCAMGAALAVLVSAAMASAEEASPVAGTWQATADLAGAQIPFRLELTGDHDKVGATFFDGSRPTNPASDGRIEGGHLHLTFPSYAAVIDATVTDGKLEGTYVTPTRSIQIHAVRGAAAAATGGPAPAIGGEWIVPYKSEKGEAAWRLIVRQTGASAEAAILRIDGDTGTLNGRYENGAFRLSHFAGERPATLEITPQPDRSLKLVLTDGGGARNLTAVRPTVASKAGIAPTDPTKSAGVQNRAEPFRFAFRDLNGKLISNTDARFRHKVVVIDIMGSWCPNCHDEAPYLQTLYAEHQKDGLEVVALDFEQRPDELVNPHHLRAFVARYGLTYAVLLAGETKEVNAKLPQITHVNAWPTTYFLGRDGRVKATHVGFTSPGSGQRDVETRRDVEKTIVQLLAQK